MKWLLALMSLAFAACETHVVSPTISLSGPCTILRFDKPSRVVNEGTKFTAFYIENPATNRWELVWGDKYWDETWIKDYVRFDGRSDDVHNGGQLIVLKPVTLGVSVFGDGNTTARCTDKPSFLTLAEKPVEGAVFNPESKQNSGNDR